MGIGGAMTGVGIGGIVMGMPPVPGTVRPELMPGCIPGCIPGWHRALS